MSSPGQLRIVSGGQTGVDRAALDFALEAGIDCGGWCPLGRRAEDGPIALRYPLKETPSPYYDERTRWNVRDSDATLIVHDGRLSGGTALTRRIARELGKAFLCIDLGRPEFESPLLPWIEHGHVGVLNVAGPRESTCPGIYARVRGYLGAHLLPIVREAPRETR